MEINLDDKIRIQVRLAERVLKDPLVGFYDSLRGKEPTRGIDSFKQFLGVYRCVRREFPDDVKTRAFGTYCGALYGLYLLNGAAKGLDRRGLMDFKLNFERNNYFFIRDLINNYLKIAEKATKKSIDRVTGCLLYTSPSPRDLSTSRMPSSA